MRSMFTEVSKNKFSSVILMTCFMIVIILLGYVFGKIFINAYFGLSVALFISLIYTLTAFYSGDKMLLSITGAKEARKKDYPHFVNAVEGLAIAAGIPAPKPYVIEDSALNAFATGRDPKHASITVTTGLLKKMNNEELDGVLAHEMSHVKNYDIRFMMLAAVLVGIVVLLSDFMLRSFLWGRKSDNNGNSNAIIILIGLVLAILAPIFVQLVKLAISRRREFMADASGAIITRYPPGLADALEKIKNDPDPLVDNANRATAPLFISSPFRKAKGKRIRELFSTHPDINERIKRLREM